MKVSKTTKILVLCFVQASHHELVLSNGVYEKLIPHIEVTNNYFNHFIPFFTDRNHHIPLNKKRVRFKCAKIMVKD